MADTLFVPEQKNTNASYVPESAVKFPIYTVVLEGAVGDLVNGLIQGLKLFNTATTGSWNDYTWYQILSINSKTIAQIDQLENDNIPFFTTSSLASAYANQLNTAHIAPNNSYGDISYSELNQVILDYGYNASSNPGSTTGPAPTNPSTPIQTAEQEIQDIWNFLNKLTERNTWIRVGEFTAGAILLAICIKTLAMETGTGKAIQATAKSASRTATKLAVAAAA
jgi:hypothetical protein